MKSSLPLPSLALGIMMALSLTLSAWSPPAGARWNQTSPALEKFREACHLHRASQTLRPTEIPAVGTIAYLPLSVLESAQGRFSYARALETQEKGEDAGLEFDEGRSPYGFEKAGVGVVYRGKVYLTDGNHKAISLTASGRARTMPIEIIKHWNDSDSPKAFQEGMERLGLGHWRDYNGRMMEMRDLCELVNDPNLQLARLEIRRLDVVRRNYSRIDVVKTAGGKNVNALKINNDIPFYEIEYGDALHQADEAWDDLKTEDDLTRSDLKRHMRIVREKAALDPRSPLNQILLLDRPTHYAEIDYERLVAEHILKHDCEHYLSD